MNQPGRRSFVLRAVTAGCLLGLVHAEAFANVDESDALAIALGYKSDTARVDATKYPNHAASQQCNGCKHFQGAATDASAGCTLFGGKAVAAKGWCSSWVTKA